MGRALPVLLLALAVSGCAGEVTRLEVGERGDDLARYRDEVQPILAQDDTDGDAIQRDCSMTGCHGGLIGNLQIIKNPDEDQLRENYRLVSQKVDPDAPEQSILLTDPLCGLDGTFAECPEGSSHPVRSFTDPNDCCYQTVLAWIEGADNPMCGCP